MTEEKTKKRGLFQRFFKRDEGPAAPEPVGAAVEPAEEAARIRPDFEQVADHAEPDETKGIVGLTKGLEKTRSGFIGSLEALFRSRRELDEGMTASLEQILVTADIGVKTAYQLLEKLTASLKRKEFDDPDAIMMRLRSLIEEMLVEVESPLRLSFGPEPLVVMVVGVNGSGKTTTIAKIAARHKAAGGKVLMVAGDTFRAAAVEQLEVWGGRIGCPVARGKEGADPSAVAFDALGRALDEGTDLVLVDTAGRLHTRVPLMEQLKKMRRTLAKKIPAAPHETLLVIDASNGQNAILQAKQFNEAVPVTGIALTKLDGTSKGGCLVGISNELGIPVRYIGIGEKMHDLRDFNARDFTAALFAGTSIPDRQ